MKDVLARTLRSGVVRRGLALADRAAGGRLKEMAGAASARLRERNADGGAVRAELAMSFPPQRAPELAITAFRYPNRREFLAGTHLELRANDRTTNFSLTSAGVAADGSYTVACEPKFVEAYLRWCFHLPLDRLNGAQFLHLSWSYRLSGTAPGAVAPLPVSLMLSNSGRGNKTTFLALKPLPPSEGGWRQMHVVLGLSGLPADGLLNLCFAMRAGVRLEIATVDAVAVSLRAGGELPPAPAGLVFEGQPMPGRARTGPAAPPQPGPYGFVAGLGSLRVAGLGWGAEAETTVELVAEGAVAGSAVLRQPPVTLNLAAEPGQFVADLPARFADRQERLIALRFARNAAPLANSPVAAVFDPQTEEQVEGLFWLEADGDLAGWAVDRAWLGSPARLDVAVDGEVVGSVVADAKHPVLAGPEFRDGFCAFRMPLAGLVRGGGTHRISVRAAGGRDLPGGPALLRSSEGRYAFRLDEAAHGRMAGWAIDLDDPATPLDLDVFVDKRAFGRITADKPSGVPGVSRRNSFRASYPRDARLVEFRRADGDTLAVYDVFHALEPVRGHAATATDRAALGEAHGNAMAALRARPGDFVDAAWYFAAHPEAAGESGDVSAEAALAHWLDKGAARGWSPAPWFDEAWYRAEYEDVRALLAEGAVQSGFLHWLAAGADEWRRPHPAFSSTLFPLEPGTDPRAVARRWLEAPFTPEPPGRAAVVPSKPGEDRLAARVRRDSLFDLFVQRIAEDLRRSAPAAADALRTGMDDADTESLRRCTAMPVPGEPLVSIIMPTFNRGFLIGEGIQSVLDQAWQNWELIVCDDGSTDRTASVVAAVKDPRIRYLALQKANGAAARNVGIRFARGRFIAFLDSDNIWHPLFLRTALAALAETGAAMIYLGYVDSQTEGPRFTKAELRSTPFDYQALLNRNFVDLNTIVIRAEIPQLLGAFDETLPRVQDWDLVLRYAHIVDPVHIPLPLILYRRNAAWGQVTDLFAHTDFNALVRERALNRVEYGAPSLWAAPPGRPAVSLVAAGREDGLRAVALAALLEEVAEVRVLLPRAAGLEGEAAALDLEKRVRIVWLAPGAAVGPALSGAFTVAADAALPLLRAEGLAPELVLTQRGVHAVLLDAALPADPGFVLGTLHLSSPHEEAVTGEPPAAAARRLHAVALAAADAAEGWAAALAASCPPGKASLLAVPGAGRLTRIDAAGREELDFSWPALSEAVADASALLLAAIPAATLTETLGLAVEAMRGGTLIFADAGTPAAEWIARGCAFELHAEPGFAADSVGRVVADKNSARTQRRARREYGYRHRAAVMRQRLATYLELKRAEGDEA